jgi:hypothetical protein
MQEKRRLNSRKGGAGVFLLGCFVFILILVGGAVLTAGYLGLIPAVSKLMGTNKPRDLGVRYANIDVAKIYESIGTKTLITRGGSISAIETELLLKGAMPIKFSLTSEELTALANSSREYNPFSDIQIKIEQDGAVRASGMLITDRIISHVKSLSFSEKEINIAPKKFKIPAPEVPVYIKGKFSVKEGKVHMDTQTIEIGKISLPSFLIEKISPQITSSMNSVINSLQGIYIKSLSFNEGRMSFEGTVSAKLTVLSE